MSYWSLVGDLVVERLDFGPQVAHVRDLARDGIGARDAADVGTRVLLHADRESPAPIRLTRLLVVAVTMISRAAGASGFAREAALHRVPGSSASIPPPRNGSFATSVSTSRPDSQIFEYDSSIDSSGRGQALALALPFDDFIVGHRQCLERAVERAAALECVDHMAELDDALGGARLTQKSRDSAGSCCAAPAALPRRSWWRAARCASCAAGGRTPSAGSSRILRLTSTSEQLTPAELSMKSVLMWPPASRVLDTPALRQAEIAAFADDAAPQFHAIYAHRVVCAVADLGMSLVRRLHVGADTAIPEQVDRQLQDRPDDVVRRRRVRVDAQQVARLGANRDRFVLPRVDGASLG